MKQIIRLIFKKKPYSGKSSKKNKFKKNEMDNEEKIDKKFEKGEKMKKKGKKIKEKMKVEKKS